MRETTYDTNTNVASIQPGTTWATVYGDLEPYGVTVAGGRTGTVGIGGFILGGGNTFFAAREGFGCDNVVNFEIVLANGYVLFLLVHYYYHYHHHHQHPHQQHSC